MSIRNDLLHQILITLGGTSSLSDSRNETLQKIVLIAGGTVSNPDSRNSLLNDYLAAI